jgi:hypothetical protein
VLGIAATASLHPCEAQGFDLAGRGRDETGRYAVLHEVLLGNHQVAVLGAAVTGVLDL